HRVRRPSWWRTVETAELAGALREARGAVLVDGLGTWLAAVMDRTTAWEDPAAVLPHFAELVDAWRQTPACVVAVTDEVGLSLVPDHPAGRLFRDLLGTLNQRLAAESEEVALVVAGRVLALP
ncbi:bifunctional adenosylcobinamide kinase/adenosylcobinamide-phosphate guanylyltransferase, partial [Actinocorallia lasiicapitis]